MRIAVTDQHIMLGLPGHGAFCPVALAMKDRGFTGAHVVDRSISWDEGDVVKCVLTPQSVREFLDAYDNGRLVCAFDFEIKEV